MEFNLSDINEKEWQTLDFFLEEVEKGTITEKELLNNESFLHMLAAVKFNSANFMNVPHFIRASKLTEKYCQQVNPNVIGIINNKKLTKKDIYKKYLQFEK